MNALIRAETRKLTSIRSYWLLAAGALVIIASGVTATAAASTSSPGTSPARDALALAGVAQTVALIAGALALTTEFRHKTITPAVLITPGRTPLIAAKLAVLTAAGLVYGLLATGAAAAITLPVLASRHIPAGVGGGQLAAIILGGGLATALAAALGTGLGAIIRNQVGAIVAILAVLYVAEPLVGFVPHLGTAVREYGLGGLAAAATRTTGYPAGGHPLGQAPAIGVMAAYAAIAAIAGAVLLSRRDITT